MSNNLYLALAVISVIGAVVSQVFTGQLELAIALVGLAGTVAGRGNKR